MKKTKGATELCPQPKAAEGSGDSRARACFHRGTNAEAYEYLGVHSFGEGFVFRVFAPHADAVSVCGDFNDWRTCEYPMTKISEGGIWEAVVACPGLREGSLYKYLLRSGEKELFKADPYGFCKELPPGTASVVCDLDYRWRDEGWLRYRGGRFRRGAAQKQPINIYELHLGSWKRHEDGSYYSYAETAGDLIPYVKQMGYTHVELLPVTEYPFDGSWGYQCCGYYAPSARFGSPADFMAFVDSMHEAGIGVILDWVPAHFPKDEHGLFEFDGSPLYEPSDPGRRDTPRWGTRYFDLGRPEVQSFLISCAVFWAKKYHIDGLRTDAVAAALYLDFDKAPGEWTPNHYGDNRNLEAIAFFQKLNSRMAAECPDVMMIAEESSAWKGVTGFEDGGLGFTFKWNMGWTNDSLAYLSEDPIYRRYHHHKLTFPMTYSFGERYILPVSHDEVVHGKRSLIGRAPGGYEQGFANLRTQLLYMMTHPGKKLLFMGSEFGQFREWNAEDSLEWFLLDYDMHAKTQLFTAELNHFYLANPPLWERDASPEGFTWIDADNEAESIYSYRRRDQKGRELIILLNFLPVRRENFLLGVPESGIYEEVFNSDHIRYGGGGILNSGKLKTRTSDSGGHRQVLCLDLPPMSGLILCCQRRSARKTTEVL